MGTGLVEMVSVYVGTVFLLWDTLAMMTKKQRSLLALSLGSGQAGRDLSHELYVRPGWAPWLGNSSFI